MKDFRQIQVWHKSHQLVLDIYRVTKGFLPDEKFGLTSQLRRAAASIPTNIAEGCGKSTDKDFARFLQISYGSANEVDYLLLLAKDLSMLRPDFHDKINNNLVEVKKMLAALIRKVRP
jgi:four helix bundle protein